MPENDSEFINEEVLEDAQFEQAIDRALDDRASTTSLPQPPEASGSENKDDSEKNLTFTQWSLGGNGRFSPSGASVDRLPAGVYEAFSTPGSWGVERLKVESDEIYELPDMATNTVLDEAEKFWNSEAKYREHDLLYKRGIMLYGPPGSGKTITIKLLIKKLIARNGIVLIANHIPLSIMALKAIKRIEPNRNIICIFEDIDEIIYQNGEANVLSMLDGEHNVDRVMNIATTNYPDKLGARIINRPSRFDRRMKIDMPTPESRAFYLSKATSGKLPDNEIAKWVEDTQDMSVAHLRELVVAVYCLDQPYEDVIQRLKDMTNKIKIDDEFKSNSLGFAGNTSKRTSPVIAKISFK